MTNKPEIMLWLSDARGQYIPRDFAQSFADRAKSVTGVSDEDWAILEAGPDSCSNESYWDAWDDVCNNAVVTNAHGNKYTIWQNDDYDCWLVPIDMEWNDETDCFDWPDERAEQEEETE